MVKGPSRDTIITNPPADEDTGNDSRVESVTAMTSSPTCGAALMVRAKSLSYQTSSRKPPSLMASVKPTTSVAGLLVM
jgi:hypothetical protein